MVIKPKVISTAQELLVAETFKWAKDDKINNPISNL